MSFRATNWQGFPPVMGRLLFWACIALIGLAMLALYRGWWPFGISSTF